MNKGLLTIVFVSLGVIFSTSLIFTNITETSAQGANCWSYTIQGDCEASIDCQWHEDPWSSWCEEKGCWNFWNETYCSNSVALINKSCNWRSNNASTGGWCTQINCFVFGGVDSDTCINNDYGLTCTWEERCHGPGMCWEFADSETCLSNEGCMWGDCQGGGCWQYINETSCELPGSVGSMGNACSWNSESNYCYETSCWDHASDQSACTTAGCFWSGGTCTEYYCSSFSYTNFSTCLNNTANLSCNWNGPYCEDQGCWTYQNQTACEEHNESSSQGCYWETFTGTGWCEEVGCWSYDGTNADTCENNTANLSCIWDGSQWCYENLTSLSCAGITNEFDCYDTFYCWWDSVGATCNDPTGGDAAFDMWNPGCYIFDMNQTLCENVYGCTWSGTECDSNSTITDEGLMCAYINDSNLCNTIPVLSSCCSWQGDRCASDQWSTGCRDSLTSPPAGAEFCEDYNAYDSQTLCEQIANSPWFMPCIWDSTSQHCQFKGDDVFGGGSSGLDNINNQQNCEAAGGKWIFETYCDGTSSVPSGRCELKFNEDRNCDRACYSCEYQSDGTVWSTALDAETACESSALGFCQFYPDIYAPNGFGYCDPRSDVVGGGFESCESNCASCAYMGDILEGEPQQACANSGANCEWFTDPVDASNGWCGPVGERTCAEDCTKCYEQTSCSQTGQGGSGECSWDTSTLLCTSSSGSQNAEICFDGVDNDGDGNMDCSDSECFSDPFCGGSGLGFDCFGYTDNVTCISNNCTWINETWGEWCDIPGADCWKYDGNQAQCLLRNDTCQWSEAFGGGFCDVDSTQAQTCMGLSNDTCISTENCTWVEDMWCQNQGGWCNGEFHLDCWQYMNQTSCNATSGCNWTSDSWCDSGNTGWCDYEGFSCWQHPNQTACVLSGCNWTNDTYSPQGGWCDSPCFNPNLNQTECESASCVWKGGFCNPLGFGGGGAGGGGSGFNCFQHNGDETACNAATGCTFSPNPMPFCDVNFTGNCPQYFDNTSCENATITGGNCKWNPDNNFCGFLADECFWNFSLQGGEPACEENGFCTWNNGGGFCEPSCFNSTLNTDQTACNNLAVCSWATGWCDSAMSAGHFDDMDQGEIFLLAMDMCPETGMDAWVDICGIGVKDMSDTYGFGMKVVSLTDSAICNGISTMSGTGTGTAAGKYYIYLDTDGSASGNCPLKDNSTNYGWEFYFKYDTNWSTSTNSLIETRTSYKCVDGEWGVADVPFSGERRIMCSDIGGVMFGIEKDDLNKFPHLYIPGSDLRVYSASANASDSITSPSDTAGPGYLTPGTVDFKPECCWDVGADCDADGIKSSADPDCSDLNRDGFMKFEDCFPSGIDEDNDGLSDCDDMDCKYFQYCVDNNLGVNDPSYVDTTSPTVVSVKKEVYPDSALIMYDTSEPANGTLFFYANDSSCATVNTTVYDIGINDSNVREFKIWHTGELYNDGGNYSLDYNLTPNSTYYYKLKVCDPSNNCGTSACLNFNTTTNSSCGICNFTARLKAPTGWTVSYDTNQDGTYEHVQGQVCGENAGLRLHYTVGRRVNIKLDAGSSTEIIFTDATLTKTALNDKVRTISTSGDVKSGSTTTSAGSTIYYTGMESEVRDKMIMNLHPQGCRIKIPGTADELWHCDDDLENCQQRTDATLVESGADYRLWDVPYCEFSTWVGGEPGTQSGTPPGGSPGGGSSPGSSCTEDWTCADWTVCANNLQTRTCTDSNECGTETEKPAVSQSCTVPTGDDTTTPQIVCGNGVCEPGENSNTCLVDCPLVPDTCTLGEKRCSGSVVQECTDGTGWAVIETCRYGCENAVCKGQPNIQITDLTSIMLIVIVGVAVVVAVVGSFVYRKKGKRPKMF